jgi:hypothetical protein
MPIQNPKSIRLPSTGSGPELAEGRSSQAKIQNALAVPYGAVLLAMLLTACNQPPAVNPWRDDSIPPSTYGTASSEAVLAANEAPAIRQREVPPAKSPEASYEVPHYPLWWEDPFEDQGDKDGQFAWTWQDYFDMPYGLARFILNTCGWPVSAIVTPPGTPMVSDGVVEKVHDAKRGFSPDPTAGPEDFDATAELAASPSSDVNSATVPR